MAERVFRARHLKVLSEKESPDREGFRCKGCGAVKHVETPTTDPFYEDDFTAAAVRFSSEHSGCGR
jgi:hypothetical protein